VADAKIAGEILDPERMGEALMDPQSRPGDQRIVDRR
jgi:hypothetical protein